MVKMITREKMIWTAVYAAEFRRCALGLDGLSRQLEPYDAARFAVAVAARAVGAVREAVDDTGLADTYDQSYLHDVLSGRRSRARRVPGRKVRR
jgi:hypothetical protein